MAVNAEFLMGLLAEVTQRNGTPGAQFALYLDGETMLAETGVERFGGGAPVSCRSTFPYGSVTKAFTATVVVQLAAEGDLDLDEPLGAAIPELAGAPNGLDREVTPRHLLSHTSGLPCDFAENGTAASLRRHALTARELEPVYPPGIAFSYSNAGFVLCGLLIEDVTGMSWWDAVETLVLTPLGVEPVFLADPRVPPRARPSVAGHSVSLKLGRTVPVEPLCAVFDAPAGALAGSAADLLAFGRLHAEAGRELAVMRTGAPQASPFGLATGWGLGLARFRSGAADWFGHDGTTDGTTAHLRFQPELGVVLALTTNAGNGLRLWEDVLAGLRAEGLDVGNYPAPTITARPATEVPDCVGEYVNGEVCYSVARAGDGALRLDLDDGLRRDLTFYEGLLFRAEDPTGTEVPVAGRFVRGGGAIRLMEIGGRVVRRKGDRPVTAFAERARLNTEV